MELVQLKTKKTRILIGCHFLGSKDKNLLDDIFGGIWSLIGCDVSCDVGTVGGGGCRAKRGSRNRTLFTIVGFTGAIRVRTFDTGNWLGIKVGCGGNGCVGTAVVVASCFCVAANSSSSLRAFSSNSSRCLICNSVCMSFSV